MQDFSVAFGRVSRIAVASNSELNSQVTDLLNRAYYNLHGTPLTSTDTQWVKSLTATAMQLCMDDRVRSLSPRERVQLFEHVIRISEEHQREARRHAAMANNVFYLKETALDATLTDSRESAYHSATTTIISSLLAHTGRVELKTPADTDA